jgi:predicted RNA-binding protein with RPS1 domain
MADMKDSPEHIAAKHRPAAEGDSLIGTVSALKAYGAFVRLADGEVGLIHISEVTEGFVRDISQYLRVGQTLVVKVLGRNEEGKLNLSLKRLTKQDEAAAQYRRESEQVQHALEGEQPARWLERRKQLDATRVRLQPATAGTGPLTTWIPEARRSIAQLRDRARGRERLLKRLYL